MGLVVKAWRLRQAARQALDRGTPSERSSWRLKRNTRIARHTEILYLLSAWLSADFSRRKRCDVRR